MKIAIVSDSNSGITQKEAEQLGFYLLPTPILIDGEQYLQDINLTQDEFYERLKQGASVSTSQPNTYDAAELWNKLLKEYDQVLYFPISSGLSETCFNLQKLAAADFAGKVFVIDNKRVSVTLRQSMMDAKKLADEGKDGAEIEKWLLETRSQSSIYIVVTTLEYLKRSGRLNAPSAFFGTMLSIKPILQIQGEKLEQYKKVRKLSDAKTEMIAAMKKDFETRFKDLYEAGKMTVAVAHTQYDDEAVKFAEQIKAEFPKAEFTFINPLNLSVAVHIGPGALAIACSVKY